MFIRNSWEPILNPFLKGYSPQIHHHNTLSSMVSQMLNHFVSLSKNGPIHQDLQPRRIKQNLKDVESVISILRYNVINRDKEWSLKTLSRGIFLTKVPPPKKKKTLEKVYDKRKVFLDSFIGYRLVSVTKFIYDLIKKLCLRTFTNID